MPAKDAEYEFCRFARQYTTDSSELERSMRETIELILNIKARVTELEANNDSLRNENVELRQELKVISTKLAESYTQSIDQCDVPYQTSPVWDYSEEYDVEKTCVKLSQKKTSTMAIFAAWKSPFARDTRFFVRFKKRQPNQPMGSQRTGDEFFSRSLPRGTL
jgi:regulator of replication initiation timing